eukprot:gene1427-1801_t
MEFYIKSDLEKLEDIFKSGFITEYEYNKRKNELNGGGNDFIVNNNNNNNSFSFDTSSTPTSTNTYSYYDYNSNNSISNNLDNPYSFSNNNNIINNDISYNPTSNNKIQEPTPIQPKPTPTTKSKVESCKIMSNSKNQVKPNSKELPISVKDNYTIYGKLKDSIVLYVKNINGNFQSKPISIEDKSSLDIVNEMKSFSGFSKFKILKFLDEESLQKVKEQLESSIGYLYTFDNCNKSCATPFEEIISYEELVGNSGHYLLESEQCNIFRSGRNLKVLGEKESAYVYHTYKFEHSGEYKKFFDSKSHKANYTPSNKLPNSTMPAASIDPRGHNEYLKDHYYTYKQPTIEELKSRLVKVPKVQVKMTPFMKQLNFEAMIRNKQIQDKSATEAVNSSLFTGVPIMTKIKDCIENVKCLFCNDNSDNMFLCYRHLDQNLIDAYRQHLEHDGKKEQQKLLNEHGQESGKVPVEPEEERYCYTDASKKFAYIDPTQLVDKSKSKTIQQIFNEYSDYTTIEDNVTVTGLRIGGGFSGTYNNSNNNSKSGGRLDYSKATDGTKIISDDPWLEPYANAIRGRHSHFKYLLSQFDEKEGGILKFSQGYNFFGFNLTPQNDLTYREWLPSAQAVFLVGEFNDWNKTSHPLERDEYGRWHIFLPNVNGQCQIPHKSKLKIYVKLANGNWDYRIPAWIKRVEQTEKNPVFDGVFWNPPQSYSFKHKAPKRPDNLKIYESHIGMASELPEICTYKSFKENVLPQVKELGYNCIQLMAIMEHAYYASFGYQVTNFYAISSRFGTPEELKELIDTAHGMGLLVFLDVVHSHASKNVLDGLNQMDGTDHLYFHSGGRGNHDVWDSRLFNYSNWEVLRFLLSNLRFYVEEYGFDGFRFDGVTSMIYYHHGLAPACSYDDYFGPAVDEDGLYYLMLANAMLQQLNPNITTIAEEVTGMAGLCRPISEGGAGFDYRLGMGIPDKWIELVKTKDEDWNMSTIAHMLSNRRYKEKNISYSESHDQSLVGDKTLAFWLMDKEMYFHMSTTQPETPIIARGLALHKMIRIITSSLGGDGYLNFMGNEFGHPEWVDFPREGNNNSYHHARRRWDLPRDPLLRYKYFRNFDIAMNKLEEQFHWLSSPQAHISLKHESDKIIVYERAGLIFIFNFHCEKSFCDYRIGSGVQGGFYNILDSDREEFGGHKRIGRDNIHYTEDQPWNDRPYSLKVYIPSRTCLVLSKKQD